MPDQSSSLFVHAKTGGIYRVLFEVRPIGDPSTFAPPLLLARHATNSYAPELVEIAVFDSKIVWRLPFKGVVYVALADLTIWVREYAEFYGEDKTTKQPRFVPIPRIPTIQVRPHLATPARSDKATAEVVLDVIAAAHAGAKEKK